ncbi:unnamed protein product [Heligmosomoides polygyrus]|uniref:GAT domain-containing protein n=1 Tax=Heligmosomoides polygyrus TaxID=6339 RepID=A0A183FKE5_HELPZ|nr:unnamed protein product [Heligmosomoides polygyrus]
MQPSTFIKEKTLRGQPVVQPASTDLSAQFRTARQAEDITPASSTSQLQSDIEDALALQFVRILQKNPAADIPLIKQLTDELSQLTAVKEHPEAEELLAMLANAPTLNFGSSLFENIMTIQSLIYNITARQAAIHNQFTPQAFRQDDQPRLADQLAQYGIHFSDVHDTLALATATVAEAQQVLSDLSQQHFERLLTIQDDEVFAAKGQVQPQALSSSAGTKRQMQSPTFSEEIDKLARKAEPETDAAADRGYPYGRTPSAEEEVPAKVTASVVVPAQVAAQSMASTQAVAAPSVPTQPVRIRLERAVSSGTAELVQDPRSIFRQRDFTPPRYQYPLQPQFQEEQEHTQAQMPRMPEPKASRRLPQIQQPLRVDFPEHEFYDRLEAAMADAREVRMRRRRAQFQDY